MNPDLLRWFSPLLDASPTKEHEFLTNSVVIEPKVDKKEKNKKKLYRVLIIRSIDDSLFTVRRSIIRSEWPERNIGTNMHASTVMIVWGACYENEL
ncbi:hypothetical protein NPIL_214991 [Nephila pilipes]|uniref:Uncharacterized protein n=1 Tax=Nephila pilipes TaxID=299642 RepID=A0A8X6N9H6_NEPPI|nr:hypothetical protein NPIL_214991 [Nephila pilipes]